jgi:hypothetical protein
MFVYTGAMYLNTRIAIITMIALSHSPVHISQIWLDIVRYETTHIKVKYTDVNNSMFNYIKLK